MMTPGQHYARADQILEDMRRELASKKATFDEIEILVTVAHSHALLAACPPEYADNPPEMDGGP